MNSAIVSIDEGTTNRNSDEKKSKYETRTEAHLKQDDNSCLQYNFCSHLLTLHQKLIGIQALFSYQNIKELLNRIVLFPNVVVPYNKIPFSARDMLSFLEC